MEKPVATLGRGTTCSSWNCCGERLAAGSIDGSVSIFDSREPSSSSLTTSSTFKVDESSILKIVWIPPEYGDAIACICGDGGLSIWEEVVEDVSTQIPQWKKCKHIKDGSAKALDVQFGITGSSLKMVTACSDGHVKVYELPDPLELKNWQLQADFQNVIDSLSTSGKSSCSSACVSWNPSRNGSQESSFVVGFNSNTPQVNSPKVWEFDGAHQRWLPVAELASGGDREDQVFSVAWAPNIGRPFELIAVASQRGISIWHLGISPDSDGRLSVEKVASLSGHNGEVWEMEWDMGGMTLASTGSDDGMVRLWQSNLNGVWHEQAAFEPAP